MNVREERCHAQEMAIRLAAIYPGIAGDETGKVDLKKLRWFINWFVKDIGNPPLSEAQQRLGEPRQRPNPEDYAPDDSEQIPMDNEDPF